MSTGICTCSLPPCKVTRFTGCPRAGRINTSPAGSCSKGLGFEFWVWGLCTKRWMDPVAGAKGADGGCPCCRPKPPAERRDKLGAGPPAGAAAGPRQTVNPNPHLEGPHDGGGVVVAGHAGTDQDALVYDLLRVDPHRIPQPLVHHLCTIDTDAVDPHTQRFSRCGLCSRDARCMLSGSRPSAQQPLVRHLQAHRLQGGCPGFRNPKQVSGTYAQQWVPIVTGDSRFWVHTLSQLGR